MSDPRIPEIRRALSGTIWAEATLIPIAGDASARRYFRTVPGAGPAVFVMDADPATGQATAAFVRIARYLRDADLAAPEILHWDEAAGVVIMSDLGPVDFAAHLTRRPKDEPALYDAAVEVLAKLHHTPPTPGLDPLIPGRAADMLDLTARHYARRDLTPLQDEIAEVFAALPPPDRIALRDFHSQNLIWRGGLTGTDRVGLLDFQDALLAPPGYDLASLISDARRDVSPETGPALIRNFAKATGQDIAAVGFAVAALGVQRNLRILGVFSRLAASGKPEYLRFQLRVWAYIRRDLAHPGLARLKACVDELLPDPAATDSA